MPALPPEELHAMAQAIDSGLEPRIQVVLDISAEGGRRIHDLLLGVAADLDHHAGIEASWPLYRLIATLAAAHPSED